MMETVMLSVNQNVHITRILRIVLPLDGVLES